eukprot:4012115-Pleurochrysis_carterae.AAC.1
MPKSPTRNPEEEPRHARSDADECRVPEAELRQIQSAERRSVQSPAPTPAGSNPEATKEQERALDQKKA